MPQYISNMIQVMADYVKQPSHNILKTSYFLFYIDETTEITSTEQFEVYAVFCFNNVVSLDWIDWIGFIGLTPKSKVV